MFISVVIPVHNEYDSIKELDNRLHYSLKVIKKYLNINLYVDDGSTDSSNSY